MDLLSILFFTLLGIAIMQILLYFRLLPSIVMSLWCWLTIVVVIVPALLILYLLDLLRYVGVPRSYTQMLCIASMGYSFTLVTHLNPQVRMHFSVDNDGTMPESPTSMESLPVHGIALCMNHCSFWDIFQIIRHTPTRSLVYYRTLMKHTLRTVPLFGGCFDRVGHFPVYFIKDESNCFTVDKERQAAVNDTMNRHFQNGGSLMFYPEGAMNKNPTAFLPFRYGTFDSIVQYRLRVYYLVTLNNDKVWPRGSLMGGRPTDTYTRLGFFPVDYATITAKELADKLRIRMQEVYDEMLAEVNERKPVRS